MDRVNGKCGWGEGSGRGLLCKSIKLHYVCMHMDNSNKD